MSYLEPHHELVGQGYDASGSETQGYDYELVRLERHSPVEYAITLRYVERYIPDGATVADIGAGAGHYSESLARRNCIVHLVDVAQRLLDTAVARLTAAGLERQIASVTRASATALSFLPDACCDVVLVLGPLYHLGVTEGRYRAIAEAARILRPGGLVFAAGINRLAYFRDMLRQAPNCAVERVDFHRRFLREGNFFPRDTPELPTGHLTTMDEFRAELTATFTPLVLTGVESFTSEYHDAFLQASADNAEAWLDLVEQTGATPEGLGVSDHYLFIGRR